MRKALYFLGILDDADVGWLVSHGAKRRIRAGDGIIRQGEPTGWLYFVLDGEFVVSTKGAPRIAVLRAGEVVGEISFVDSRPPTADVTAVRESLVGAVPRDLLKEKLDDDPAFASRFYRAMAVFLADRLRTTVGSLGDNELELDAGIEDADELAPHLLDDMSLAGIRFSEMQRRDWGS